MRATIFALGLFTFGFALAGTETADTDTARARDLGIEIGLFATGPLNSITDVEGVTVGHSTLIEGEDLRTGVTVVVPHPGNLFQRKVPAGVFVANGFGKLTGISQVRELGTLETPIALTGTLSAWNVADALAEWVLEQDGNAGIRSVNPVVGECNDGYLSDIRRRPVGRKHVRHALASASSGAIREGTVGAGTGTTCLGFKGGIGTASRVLPDRLGGFSIGVLVQTNFGGCLTVAGVPMCKGLGTVPFGLTEERGSCMVVVAVDAPLNARQLERVAARTPMGLARVGGSASNGSGDYAIAFSTNPQCRVEASQKEAQLVPRLPDRGLSPLFAAVVEATEEAVLNSMFAATAVTGFDGHVSDRVPVDVVVAELTRRGVIEERGESVEVQSP
ncbi:MAG: P1 family peptidase [bacterium]|nr:P1 family peptidase [bacterium]